MISPTDMQAPRSRARRPRPVARALLFASALAHLLVFVLAAHAAPAQTRTAPLVGSSVPAFAAITSSVRTPALRPTVGQIVDPARRLDDAPPGPPGLAATASAGVLVAPSAFVGVLVFGPPLAPARSRSPAATVARGPPAA